MRLRWALALLSLLCLQAAAQSQSDMDSVFGDEAEEEAPLSPRLRPPQAQPRPPMGAFPPQTPPQSAFQRPAAQGGDVAFQRPDSGRDREGMGSPVFQPKDRDFQPKDRPGAGEGRGWRGDSAREESRVAAQVQSPDPARGLKETEGTGGGEERWRGAGRLPSVANSAPSEQLAARPQQVAPSPALERNSQEAAKPAAPAAQSGQAPKASPEPTTAKPDSEQEIQKLKEKLAKLEGAKDTATAAHEHVGAVDESVAVAKIAFEKELKSPQRAANASASAQNVSTSTTAAKENATSASGANVTSTTAITSTSETSTTTTPPTTTATSTTASKASTNATALISPAQEAAKVPEPVEKSPPATKTPTQPPRVTQPPQPPQAPQPPVQASPQPPPQTPAKDVAAELEKTEANPVPNTDDQKPLEPNPPPAKTPAPAKEEAESPLEEVEDYKEETRKPAEEAVRIPDPKPSEQKPPPPPPPPPKAPQGFGPASLSQSENSHFMTWAVSAGIIVAAAYLLCHNKQKVLALLVEGRGGSHRGRRGSGARYKRLEQDDQDQILLKGGEVANSVVY